MDKTIRVLIALTILLSGVALVPYIDLPAERLTWQLFAGVYDATLQVNHPNGAPGSVFTFTGSNYPPNSVATVSVNGRTLGTLLTDGGGGLQFLLDTRNANLGTYTVTAAVNVNATAAANFELIAGGNVWPPAGAGPLFYLVHSRYMPILFK